MKQKVDQMWNSQDQSPEFQKWEREDLPTKEKKEHSKRGDTEEFDIMVASTAQQSFRKIGSEKYLLHVVLSGDFRNSDFRSGESRLQRVKVLGGI